MNPQYIVDGYNFIHKIPRFAKALRESLERSRNELILFIRGYQSAKKINITLVFDGADVGIVDPAHQSSLRLKIFYSNSPEKADPLIKRLIKKTKNKKSVILVSADQELVNYAKNMGATSVSPASFYSILSKHEVHDEIYQKYNQPLSHEEIEEWLKIFGDDS